MLRISVTPDTAGTTITIEGRLAGLWVDEVARYWRDETIGRDPRSLRVDLAAVTFIDAAGKALLRAMHEQGAVLYASCAGCMTRAVLDEIARTAGDGAHRDE